MKKYKNDEILFLSGIYPEQLYGKLTNLKSNKNIQIASDVLQKHIISGLDASIPNPIKLVNAPYVGVFPRSSNIVRLKRFNFAHCDGAEDINIPFWNIPVLRHFSIYHNSKYEIKRWAKNHTGGTVMVYALTLQNVCRLLYVKRLDRSIKTCMIVPDLPLYMRMSAGCIYRNAKKIENWLIFRKIDQIDAFVLLTKHMNDIIRSNNYCVVEGIATNSETTSVENETTKIVLYTGTLDKKYGIVNLLQAFKKIQDESVRLYICGVGDSQAAVEEMAQKDNRVCYLGTVSREEVLQLESRATVLVNPRQNIEAFTRYSFPSKNLEYLSSGVPLVAYKLDGIPDEYDPYIHFVTDNTVDALREAIERVLNCSQEERSLLGEKARQFVLENKNEVVQSRKILDMLELC